MGVGLQDVLVWTEPARILTKYGKRWVRSWVIPQDFLEGFFIFWDKNKLKLKLQGYSIGKNNRGRWCLFEWQIRKDDFRSEFGKDNQKVDPKTIVKESTLPVYNVQHADGLRPWQIPAVARLVASIQRNGAAIDGSDTGCHKIGQPILMSDGAIKLVENIVVGDAVMGWDGKAQTVTSLCRGRQTMAKIIPTKGDPWVVNLNHILTVKLTNPPGKHKTTGGFSYGSIVDIPIREYLSLPNATKHAMKLFSSNGINSWPKKDLPIDPYLLGSLLGDGGLSSNMITMTSADFEVWAHVNSEVIRLGGKLGKTNRDITMRITHSDHIRSSLKSMGLLPIRCEYRFIPDIYKTGDRSQRLDILAGLIDTDGSLHKHNVFQFCSKSKQLRDDVSFIARSLGLFVTEKCRQCSCVYKGEKKTGTYHYSCISGNIDVIPTKILRKKAHSRTQKKDPLVRGFSVELLSEDDFYGFSLDGDGRFLLGDFTVTHNTGKSYSAVAVARELGMRIAVVCPKAVISPWIKIIKKHFGMTPEFVLNYESVKSGKYKNIGKWVKVSKISTRERFEWTVHKNTLIIFDESHRLKGLNTQNSEIAIAAKQQGYRILCCSATNSIDPTQLKAVGYILGLYKKNWSQYLRDNGCEKGRFGWQFNGDKTVLAKLHGDLFLERGIRLKREDIPGFPECEIIAEAYDASQESTKDINAVYKEMDVELEALSRKCKNTAEWKINAMVIQLRALQKAELLKVPVFVEMVEDAISDGMSVAVFLNFTDTIKALSTRLRTRCIVWGENKNQAERDRNIDDFQSDKSRVILLNSAAGGTGVSLHDLNGNFPRLAIISPSYSVITFKQVLGRVHRTGALTKSVQKVVFASDTAEERVCENLQEKLNNLDAVNDADLSPSPLFQKTLGV